MQEYIFNSQKNNPQTRRGTFYSLKKIEIIWYDKHFALKKLKQQILFVNQFFLIKKKDI